MAKYLDLNGGLYLWEKIKNRFVEKEAGKGLSTNDLTNELRDKILNAGDSSFTGNYNDLTNKPFIPTKTSEITNDSGFQTAAQVTTAVNVAVAAAPHLKRELVANLPAVGSADPNTIYMKQEGDSGDNRYSEWLLINSAWEFIGTSEVDLSAYLKISDMVAITNAEIDSLFV